MSTEARAIGASSRTALFTVWTVTVSVLAAAALVLSGLALNVASQSDPAPSVERASAVEAASIGSPLWDERKLEAMETRMELAEAAQAEAAGPLWDEGKLEAMETRMELAKATQAEGTAGR